MNDHDNPRLRILLFEDDGLIRSMLRQLLEKEGWEVFSFPDPGVCPLQQRPSCLCRLPEVCADVIVTDMEMPHMDGLTFVRDLLQKGCRIQNLAMLTGSQNAALLEQARTISLAVFNKADGIAQLVEWLRKVERQLQSERRLIQWTSA